MQEKVEDRSRGSIQEQLESLDREVDRLLSRIEALWIRAGRPRGPAAELPSLHPDDTPLGMMRWADLAPECRTLTRRLRRAQNLRRTLRRQRAPRPHPH